MTQKSQDSGGWPTVEYEPRPWVPTIEVPRRRIADYEGPYLAAVTPLIADLRVVIPAALSAAADEATVELARFDSELGGEIAPFASILLRSEAAASSQIEHLTASARAIALAELGDNTRRNALEIVANTSAMKRAIDLADRLDGEAILAVQHALLGDLRPEWTGRWRSQQVWIGTSSYGPHTAAFVPPHPDRVPAAIDDLVAFMRRSDIPALVHAAIAHAQFETIHPFPDGNGRTGRALVHALLRAKGVTTNITVPVSAGLLIDINGYFAALTSFRQGDVTAIIEQFARAALAAAANGRRFVSELRATRSDWMSRLTVRRQSVVWQVLDVLLRQPVVDSAFIQVTLGVSAPASDAALARLVEAGIVRQITDGRRNRRFAAVEVLDALDQFAAGIGRRSAG